MEKSDIEPYQYVRTIAKGGMGEVILAYDPFFEREVAIKKIRSDLSKELPLKKRFLREAKLTAKLTHPGVITIYSLHQEGDTLYYSMPYIEGKTLKEILRSSHPPGIASFLPIFKSLCQICAYAHSKKVIHRDLKPENVLVGHFGETIILDWGLAQMITDAPEENLEENEEDDEPGLTLKGKIVGTLAYMAPERALGSPASFQTDIYALGVILHQILTLRLPFKRTTVKEFRKKCHLEKLLDPEEVAPYRDVPPRLSRMVKKCLAIDLTQRYKTVDELLEDLSSHMEGRSEWFESQRLDIYRNKDWEFKENILLSKHLAITPTIAHTEWVSIMLSKSAFAENTRIETRLNLQEKGTGIGFLLGVPEAEEREHPLDGYCLLLGTEEEKFSQLFRNQTLVMQIPDLFLIRGKKQKILIEKVENKIHVYIEDVLKFTYLSYFPLLGTRVGVLFKDLNFEIEDIIVSVGSPTLQVSCLSIPNAFLASRDYTRAIAEFRRIGQSFPGHAEGREALFKTGITLLEQGNNARTEKKAKEFYSLALEEFAKLHHTPGAPLEYLGKSLVYQALDEPSEEIKCLEFALRRYKNHPLIHIIEEEILYRMQECAQNDRYSAYDLILIALRHLSHVYESSDTNRLFKHLINHWEPLTFLENPIDASRLGKEDNAEERKNNEIAFAIPLAFWLAKPTPFLEILDDLFKNSPQDTIAFGNILYALCELGAINLVKDWAVKLSSFDEHKEMLSFFTPIFLCFEKGIEEAVDAFFKLNIQELGPKELRCLFFLIQFALFQTQDNEKVLYLAKAISHLPLSLEDQIQVDAFQIWSCLNKENYQEAEKLFEKYSLELLNQESTLLHPLYGCFLRGTEGEEIAQVHLSGVIDTPFPRTWALLGHEIANKILEKPSWFNTSFMWERRWLYRQLALYHHCAHVFEKEDSYRTLEKKEYLHRFS